MAWKKVILGDGTSSQFIKGDGSLDSYTYALGSSAQNGIISYDNRTTNDAPNSRSKGLYVDFKLQSTIGLTASGTYSGVLTFRSYGSGTDLSGGPPIQIAYANDGQLYTRYGNGGSAWYSWNKIIIGSGTSSQYIKGDGSFGTYSTTDSTKLPLSGGTLTGSLTTNGQIYSSSSTLQIRGAGNTPIIYGVSGATYLYAGNNTTTALTLQAGYAIAGSGFAYGAVNNYTKIIDGASGALTGTTGTFSGNVGIGNTSPASALTIDVADGQNKKALHITQNDAGEWTSKMDTSGYGLLVRSTANDTTPAIQIQGNGTSNNILTGLSNGKVGIGTTSPNAPLTLKSSASPIMLIQNADGNQQIQINANTTSGAELDIYDHASTGRIRLSARSGGDSFINTAGSANFGIGTASPSELLHVSSTGYNSAGMKIYGSKNSTLYIDKAVDGWDAKIEFQTAGTTLFEIGVDSTPGDGFFKIGRSDDNADFVINSSGKVGIGTTSPSSKLNIVYAAQTSFLDRGVLSESYGTPAHFKGFTVATADGTEASPTGLVVGEQIGGLNFLGYDGTKWRTAAMIKSEVTGVSDNTNMAAEIQFYTGTVTGDAVAGNYTGITKRMVIDSSGNVGIGTTGFTSAQRDGNAKLDVMGGINLEAYRKINFDGNGYSVHGYINLQTLDSVPKMGYYAYYGHRVKNATGSIVQFGRGHASLDTGFYGNVGIGTTTPSQKLDVQGWIATTTGIINSSSRIAMASNGTISLQNAGVNRLEVGTSGQLTVTPLTGGHVSFNNNSVDANFNVQSNNVANMLFVDGGADRVGIGTGSPAYKLEVKASVAGDWISRLYNESATGKGVLIRTDAPASADALAMGVYADSGYKMVVRSTGNVGIGTTSPTNSTDYNTLDIRGTNGGQIIAGRGAYQDFFMYTNTSAANIGALNDLAFKAGTTGSMSTPSLYLKDGGNVGIGTASPIDVLSLERITNVNVLTDYKNSTLFRFRHDGPRYCWKCERH